MNDLSDLLAYSFNQRALLGAAIIGMTNGYISGYVVLRRSALFTGALANTMFPGITLGFVLWGVSALSAFVGGLLVSLVVALAAIGIAHCTRIDKDSALCVLWTMAFAAGLLLHDAAHLHVEINDYLFGNILGLSRSDLWYCYVSGFLVLVILTLLQRPFLLFLFEPNVAQSQGIPTRRLNYLLMGLIVLTMITSVQAVGVILALGLLVAPGATMVLLVNSPRAIFWGGGVLGALLAMGSIVVSNLLNWRTGATMVLLLGIAFLLAALKAGGRRAWTTSG